MTATWSTPSDFAVAHIVTAAEWNAMEGASSNLVYLKDVLPGTIKVGTTSPAIGTIYQNTTGRIKLITIGAIMVSSTSDTLNVYTDTGTPPSTAGTLVALMKNYSTATGQVLMNITFCVPPNYYYDAIASQGSPSLNKWQEWTLATGS